MARQTSKPSRRARQADVEDDDPGILLLDQLQALLAVAGQQDAEALAAQVEVDQVGDVRIVLNDDTVPFSEVTYLAWHLAEPDERDWAIPHTTLMFVDHVSTDRRDTTRGPHERSAHVEVRNPRRRRLGVDRTTGRGRSIHHHASGRGHPRPV
jgi:hypothetical protein